MLLPILQATALVLVGLAAWALNLGKRLKYRHIPGPKPAPLLGNLPQVSYPPPHLAQLSARAAQIGCIAAHTASWGA